MASSAEKYKVGAGANGGRIISEKIEEEEDKNSSNDGTEDIGIDGTVVVRRGNKGGAVKKNFL